MNTRVNVISADRTLIFFLFNWQNIKQHDTAFFSHFQTPYFCFASPLLCINGSVSPISSYNKSMWWPYWPVADDMSYWTHYCNPEQAREKESRSHSEPRWRIHASQPQLLSLSKHRPKGSGVGGVVGDGCSQETGPNRTTQCRLETRK